MEAILAAAISLLRVFKKLLTFWAHLVDDLNINCLQIHQVISILIQRSTVRLQSFDLGLELH